MVGKVYQTGRSWAGSKREREISDMDGESGELTQWENVVGAWTGKRDRGTGMRLTERTKKLLPETWWGIPIKERSVIRKAVNWLSVCSYDYMLRQYKVNRGSQMYNLTGRSIVFSEATVLKTTEAAASVASNVATALSKWPTLSCQWYPMGDVRTHNSRTDSRRIFKLGEGVDHVTRHVWPLTKVKRSKVKVTRSRNVSAAITL